jgi:hypothetical protein
MRSTIKLKSLVMSSSDFKHRHAAAATSMHLHIADVTSFSIFLMDLMTSTGLAMATRSGFDEPGATNRGPTPSHPKRPRPQHHSTFVIGTCARMCLRNVRSLLHKRTTCTCNNVFAQWPVFLTTNKTCTCKNAFAHFPFLLETKNQREHANTDVFAQSPLFSKSQHANMHVCLRECTCRTKQSNCILNLVQIVMDCEFEIHCGTQ